MPIEGPCANKSGASLTRDGFVSNPQNRYRSCPECGGRLRRIPRRWQDRLAPAAQGLRRYRCRAVGCRWQGLLGPLVPDEARTQRGVALTSAGALAGVALAAAAAWLALEGQAGPGERVAVGESYDGDPVDAVVVPAGTDLASVALTVRQGCAWGKPGRNPYKGTVEQALQAARLPPSLAAPLAAKIHAHAVDDRLVIATQGMRAERSGEVFSPRGFALSYGHTMCLRSRVNFPAGHVERADLYEVSDASGRRAAVMVPDVCGNVSVLGARGQRGPLARAVAGAMGLIGVGAHDETDVELVSYDGLRVAQAAAKGVQAVPEPGTLACVVLALTVMVAVWWRRRLHR